MKLKYVQPKKLKILIAAFTMVGIWGIVFGLFMGGQKASINYFMIVVLGVINLVLGAFMTYLYLTQVKNIDPRKDLKYKRKK
ncbi:MAG: hypothetical protein O3C04_05935 [Crenarchaeota archaeon]|nr:hypothetical protein [Thermoproteota archaeon]MDA1125164.1 hypothetical protein [Thermoproteota archaeon]